MGEYSSRHSLRHSSGHSSIHSSEKPSHFVEDVTLRLFDEAEPTMDLVAINIQRGREHGLPGYIKYRQACGTSGGRIKGFNDLRANISPAV